MWNLFKKNRAISAPVKGKLIDITKVKDEAFSSKALGDGFAVYPESSRVVSPIDGTITVVFPSGHAYGIENDKVEIIVHIGIDTVQLNGEGFHSFVKQGETVKKGDLLAEVDFEHIQKKGYDATTVIIISNGLVPELLKSDVIVEEGEDVALIK